jgi:hypothetical protein
MPTLRGSASDLVQCRVSSRSTKLVQVRASCRRYDLRAGLRASLANCVRSDARRRQSRSSLSNCSDFDIAHRLESLMRNVARYRVSCRWPTPHTKTKRHPCEDPTTYRVVEYACNEKAPRRGGAFPKALDFGFAVSAAARYNLAAFSGCPATLRSARRSGLFIRRINQARFPTLATANSTCYAASLHCAFTSFDTLLRWTCWSTWSTHPTGMR